MGCSGVEVKTNPTKRAITFSSNLDPNIIGKNKNDTKIIVIVLLKHNELRRKHNSPELKKNDDLNYEAQIYAEELLSNHDKNYIYKNIYKDSFIGENIMLSEMKSAEAICEEWYKENQFYDFNKNTFQKNAAHFTQLIWKETKEIGIGFCKDNNKCCLVVLYYPAGNVLGEFSKNVEKVKEK
jgi:uncharacterized protein YkwD